jgi:hypothetical protein
VPGTTCRCALAASRRLLAEYVLTTRFELVSRLLAGIGVPHLADTSRLRERLRAEFGGERVPVGRHRLAINTVDAHTGAVVRFERRVLAAMREAGKRAAGCWLAAGPRVDAVAPSGSAAGSKAASG